MIVWGLILMSGLYLAVTALLFVRQRAMIYPATTIALPDQDIPPSFERVRLRTRDGIALDALYRPPARGRDTIVFFHGNGDSLAGALAATRGLAQAGLGLLLPEYRGYGGNAGTPDEQGLHRDSDAALDWLARRGTPPARTVLIGNSLGSGVATALAARTPVAALVLVSGFSSLADVAASHMRLFPVRLMLRDRYDNAAKMPHITAPILLLHGSSDTLVPPQHASRLREATAHAEVEIVAGAGHDLACSPEAQRRIVDWLSRVRPEGH